MSLISTSLLNSLLTNEKGNGASNPEINVLKWFFSENVPYSDFLYLSEIDDNFEIVAYSDFLYLSEIEDYFEIVAYSEIVVYFENIAYSEMVSLSEIVAYSEIVAHSETKLLLILKLLLI